jgi:hypothetical protein
MTFGISWHSFVPSGNLGYGGSFPEYYYLFLWTADGCIFTGFWSWDWLIMSCIFQQARRPVLSSRVLDVSVVVGVIWCLAFCIYYPIGYLGQGEEACRKRQMLHVMMSAPNECPSSCRFLVDIIPRELVTSNVENESMRVSCHVIFAARMCMY